VVRFNLNVITSDVAIHGLGVSGSLWIAALRWQ
jgi:hypothetical protein